jgi:hypothetical protein
MANHSRGDGKIRRAKASCCETRKKNPGNKAGKGCCAQRWYATQQESHG